MSGASRPTPEEVRLARAWLARVVEPGSLAVHRLLARHGPVEAARRIRAGDVPARLNTLASARRGDDRAAADLRDAELLGARFVTPEDDEWPDGPLEAMEAAAGVVDGAGAPPQAVWAQGTAQLDEVLARSVAVVGTRAASPYGQRVASDLGYALARRGWTVVSGGALGIDGAAHRGALAAGGPTVAVIAGGLRRPYPAGHVTLFDAIPEAGLLISEWPPDCDPQRHRFLLRNRVVAGATAGVVVVEAGVRSGASNTVRHAEAYGRPVMVVPGPITSASSRGCHQLVRDGRAAVVTTADEVIELVGRLGVDLAPPPPVDLRPRDVLDPVARRVLDGLPTRGPASADSIAVAAGVPVSDVLRALPLLEVSGLVRADQGSWRLTPTARKA